MPENEEVQTGDICCLKSDKGDSRHRKFTAGADFSSTHINVHWFHIGDLKTAIVAKEALHKLVTN